MDISGGKSAEAMSAEHGLKSGKIPWTDQEDGTNRRHVGEEPWEDYCNDWRSARSFVLPRDLLHGARQQALLNGYRHHENSQGMVSLAVS